MNSSDSIPCEHVSRLGKYLENYKLTVMPGVGNDDSRIAPIHCSKCGKVSKIKLPDLTQ